MGSVPGVPGGFYNYRKKYMEVNDEATSFQQNTRHCGTHLNDALLSN